MHNINMSMNHQESVVAYNFLKRSLSPLNPSPRFCNVCNFAECIQFQSLSLLYRLIIGESGIRRKRSEKKLVMEL